MIEAVVQRIKETVPEIRLVGRAAEFQVAAETNPTATPACFVIPMNELPGSPAAANVMIQRVDVTVGVIFVVKNLSDNKGAAAGVDLDVLRQKVRDQVFGWSAAPELDPFARGSGQLLAFREGHIWWQDLFITSYYDRSVL